MKTLLGEETSNQIQSLLNGQGENLSFVNTKVKKIYFNVTLLFLKIFIYYYYYFKG
jgi:hypothetical protein